MKVQHFYDAPTYTLTYVAYDEASLDAVIIDPVLDYEPQSSKYSEDSARTVLQFVREKGLKVHYVLETHAHADHLTAAQMMKRELPEVKTAIHENIRAVQEVFKGLFNFGAEFDTEGKVFDVLLKDGDSLQVGTLKIDVLHTPGHTPACMSLLINHRAVFTGDALFMPDYGTGRCDFPKGSAEDLYHSVVNKLYALNDDVEVYVGHDYQPGGRELAYKTTIGEEKRDNIQLKATTSKEEFVAFRNQRDAGLMAPRLLLASIQVNAQNGIFPKADDNGVSYLKIPLRPQS